MTICHWSVLLSQVLLMHLFASELEQSCFDQSNNERERERERERRRDWWEEWLIVENWL